MDKQRWPLVEAEALGDAMITLLAPVCERIVVAGSVRRRKPMVGDLELLAIPRYGAPLLDMFSRAMAPLDLLTGEVDYLIAKGLFTKRLSSAGHAAYGPLNKLLVHVPTGIPVDLFTTEARYWGMALVVRTGPAEFNMRLMARYKSFGAAGHAYAGVTDERGTERDCPDEETVFALAGWNWIPPERRV